MGVRLGSSALLVFTTVAAFAQDRNASNRLAGDVAAEWHTESAAKTLAQIEFSVQSRYDTPKDAGRVVLEVVIRNTSDSPIFFSEQSPDWDYQIDLVGPDGQSTVELTNFGKCVLPHPAEVFRNIGRRLEPGEKDHVESVELNRLFKLDRVGLYRVLVRRRVWLTAPYQGKLVSSEPAFFAVALPQADSSPPGFDPARCR